MSQNDPRARVAGTPPGDLEREIVAAYEAHCAELLATAGFMLRNEDAARDAVQETFLRFFMERSYGRQIGNPRAWLYRVLRNHILDRLDLFASKCEVSEDATGIPDQRCSPEASVRRSQMADRITAALSDRELNCLRLRAEGFSYAEIADAMGVASGTVSSFLTRVHKKLGLATGDAAEPRLDTAGALYLLVQGAPHHSP